MFFIFVFIVHADFKIFFRTFSKSGFGNQADSIKMSHKKPPKESGALKGEWGRIFGLGQVISATQMKLIRDAAQMKLIRDALSG